VEDLSGDQPAFSGGKRAVHDRICLLCDAGKTGRRFVQGVLLGNPFQGIQSIIEESLGNVRSDSFQKRVSDVKILHLGDFSQIIPSEYIRHPG
jgi:hypothetical protein